MSSRLPAVPPQLLRFLVVERARRIPSNSACFLRRYFTLLGQVESRPSHAARILRHRNKGTDRRSVGVLLRFQVDATHASRDRYQRWRDRWRPVAYGSKTMKTRQLVAQQYYWPRLPSDCDTYINNCKGCKWNHLPRNKMPGLSNRFPLANGVGSTSHSTSRAS
jgi:Integrase zinc binding domain